MPRNNAHYSGHLMVTEAKGSVLLAYCTTSVTLFAAHTKHENNNSDSTKVYKNNKRNDLRRKQIHVSDKQF